MTKKNKSSVDRLEYNRFRKRMNKLRLTTVQKNTLIRLYRKGKAIAYFPIVVSFNRNESSFVYEKRWVEISINSYPLCKNYIRIYPLHPTLNPSRVDTSTAKFLIRKKLVVADISYKEYKIQKALGVSVLRFYKLNETLYKKLR